MLAGWWFSGFLHMLSAWDEELEALDVQLFPQQLQYRDVDLKAVKLTPHDDEAVEKLWKVGGRDGRQRGQYMRRLLCCMSG